MKTTKIYVLRDPRTDEIRYVGKTVEKIEKRLRGHISDSRRSKFRTATWIAALAAIGLRPKVELIEEVAENWQDREKYWIAFYRASVGVVVLTNHTDGGEGTPGFRPSIETRMNLSAAHRRRYQDPAARLMTGAQVKAALADPEWKESQSIKQKGLWANPEQRAIRVASQRKAAATPESRLRKSEAAKKMWTPERKSSVGPARREKALEQWSDPERRKAHSERLKEICTSKEAKVRLEKSRAACATPEAYAKRLAWWTPERRAAKAEQMRLQRAKRKQNDSESNPAGCGIIELADGDPPGVLPGSDVDICPAS